LDVPHISSRGVRCTPHLAKDVDFFRILLGCQGIRFYRVAHASSDTPLGLAISGHNAYSLFSGWRTELRELIVLANGRNAVLGRVASESEGPRHVSPTRQFARSSPTGLVFYRTEPATYR